MCPPPFLGASERTKLRNNGSCILSLPLGQCAVVQDQEAGEDQHGQARVGLRGQGKHVLILDNPEKELRLEMYQYCHFLYFSLTLGPTSALLIILRER